MLRLRRLDGSRDVRFPGSGQASHDHDELRRPLRSPGRQHQVLERHGLVVDFAPARRGSLALSYK